MFGVPFGNSGTYTATTLQLLEELGYFGVALAEGETLAPARFEREGKLVLTNRFLARNEPTLW